MAKRVFFSFHWARDIFRSNTVRNSWVTKDGGQQANYIDAASWEQVKRKGDDNIKAWIAQEMKGCSVTAVLIGNETSTRPWVLYEIAKSWDDGRSLIGIKIHNIKCARTQSADWPGNNPFDRVSYTDDKGQTVPLSRHVPVFDWVSDDGYNNLGKWIAALP